MRKHMGQFNNLRALLWLYTKAMPIVNTCMSRIGQNIERMLFTMPPSGHFARMNILTPSTLLRSVVGSRARIVILWSPQGSLREGWAKALILAGEITSALLRLQCRDLVNVREDEPAIG